MKTTKRLTPTFKQIFEKFPWANRFVLFRSLGCDVCEFLDQEVIVCAIENDQIGFCPKCFLHYCVNWLGNGGTETLKQEREI